MRSTHARLSAFAFTSALTFASACTSDQLVAPSTLEKPSAPSATIVGGGIQRYVAIGTSISAGVQSDGLFFATQAASWPAQLAGAAGIAFNQPLIASPGCRSPILAPLILGLRLSGESALTPAASLSCAPLLGGVTLPVDNVSLNGALTKDALLTTAQNITDAGNAQIYARVLEFGQTQVSTMIERNPQLVSVELGSNEVLEASSGVAIPGVTLFPFSAWAPLYHSVLDNVQAVTRRAVVVGLIDDIRHVPAFRTGDELWADRAEFAAFHVAVSANCHYNQNLIFVPILVTTTVASGLQALQQSLPPVPLSCAAGGLGVEDFILTPLEQLVVNLQMQSMSAQIRLEALGRGFAYFPLGALYDRSDVKGPFSVTTLMLGNSPFGPYFSNDGLHPSALGQTVLAKAAAQALNNRFGLGIVIP